MKYPNRVLDKYISVVSQPRPIKIAYLIEENDEADKNINYAFEESYSRWGGRYTLIVPLNNEEINEKFWKWLKSFDPDIIYCFKDLSENLIKKINRNHCLMHLENRKKYYTPHNWVKSKTLILHGTQVVENRTPATISRFALENFGKIYQVNNIGSLGSQKIIINNESDLLGLIYLNPSDQVFCEDILSFSECEVLKDASHKWCQFINVFVGDTFLEKVSFWNAFLSDSKGSNGGNLSLIIAKELMENEGFIDNLGKWFNRRIQPIKIRSGSLTDDEAKSIIERIKAISGLSFRIEFERIIDINECADREYYSHSSFRNQQPDYTQLVNSNRFHLVYRVV